MSRPQRGTPVSDAAAIWTFVGIGAFFILIAMGNRGWKVGFTADNSPAARALRAKQLAHQREFDAKAREAKKKEWEAKNGRPYPVSHLGQKAHEVGVSVVGLGITAAAYEAYKHRKRRS